MDIGWFRNVITAPNFENLPKSVVLTASCDPMRDEGEAYVAKLLKTGIKVYSNVTQMLLILLCT